MNLIEFNLTQSATKKPMKVRSQSSQQQEGLLNYFLQLHPKPNFELPASPLRAPNPRFHTS